MSTSCPLCHSAPESLPEEAPLTLRLRAGDAELIVPRRHIGAWLDLRASERAEVLELLEACLNERRDDGPLRWGAVEGPDVTHWHLRVEPAGIPKFPPKPETSPAEAGAATQARILATGGLDDPFEKHLRPLFHQAESIAILAAFVQASGVGRLSATLADAVARGARVRVLTGDYLHITQARALTTLLDLHEGVELGDDGPEGEETEGDGRAGGEDDSESLASPIDTAKLELRVIESAKLKTRSKSFHPKSWIFVGGGADAAFVGSSNLSRAALTDGVEWNLRLDAHRDGAGFLRVLGAFEDLWQQARAVDADWLDSYRERAREIARALPGGEVEDVEEGAPEPRDVQVEALAALAQAREDGRDRAIVVLATGLGKTWLSAFDVQQFEEEQGRPARVLFLAHRVELLRQAAKTFRRLFPDKRFGWLVGAAAERKGDIVFASVMKLARQRDGRAPQLEAIRSDAFDYIIVDEVHHADAVSYRRVLSHFESGFRLGLTATPERADGGDILGLFDDFVAFEAGIPEGVRRGQLVPFHYFGRRDTVDYAPIPWRNSRFDPAALEQALQTEERMASLLEAMEEHAGSRTLMFCCSIAHARFVRRWLGERGMAVRAVFSQPGSDDREDAVEALGEGSIEVLCAVDLFNEGLDLPAIDRVVMLRPTESPTIFLQQLGRGLRVAEDKDALTVIDFVGNHKVFLQRVRTLLELAGESGGDTLRRFLDSDGETELPTGCAIRVELEAVELLRNLMPQGSTDRVIAAYRDLASSRDRRPTAGDLYRAGFEPSALKGYESWFAFLADEDDLDPTEREAFTAAKDFLADLERKERMNRSFKMVTLLALCEAEGLLDGMSVEAASLHSRQILRRSPELLADVPEGKGGRPDEDNDRAWITYWKGNPLRAWSKSKASVKSARGWFTLKDGHFTPRFAVPDSAKAAFEAMVRELVDYRLAQYRRRRRQALVEGAASFEAKIIRNSSKDPILKLPDRERFPGLPLGETDVRLPDGASWSFKFVKIACNVARPVGRPSNELPDLLRSWFGPEAGQPGTTFHVRFRRSPEGWWAEPVQTAALRATSGLPLGRIRAFPSLRAAAGWTHEGSAAGIEPATVALPGVEGSDKRFAVRAAGNSMDGGKNPIRNGDWLIMEWARSAGLPEVRGRVALVQRSDGDTTSFHLKRVRKTETGFELASDNPTVGPMLAVRGDTVIALVTAIQPPEAVAPPIGESCPNPAAAFGLSESPRPPLSRVDGHLFLVLQEKESLRSPTLAHHPAEPPLPGETAFVLGRQGEDRPWIYLGVGRWSEPDHAWRIPEVDFDTWRALGKGRSASREIDPKFLEVADKLAERLTTGELPRTVITHGKSCVITGRSARGGVRVEGVSGAFKERTVSKLDLAWVLAAKDAFAGQRVLDESLVNRLRYLSGTPKGSTRWIDTGWAIVLVGVE